MEIPIQVAIRLKPPSLEDSTQCIFSNPTTQIVVTESGQTFHVNRALPVDCNQVFLFNSFMIPQINCFLDGCDTSVVTFGQSKTGKTYTLFGLGFECIHSEFDQGIIPRFITEVFHKQCQISEREFIVHIAWMQLVNGNLYDVLGSGLVRVNNVEEAFQYLQLGWRSQNTSNTHTVFTISMEQKWVNTNGILNHRLSTASFCELASYPDPSLFHVENVIRSLLEGTNPKQVNYEQSILTAMLRDSLGGRAFTWVIGCISTDPDDYQETLKILNLCLSCRSIKNFVTVNVYADNNLPLVEKGAPNIDNSFGLQFAAAQWVKLVSNAEGLFNKILQSKTLNEEESNQISEWLFLKAECDECLNNDSSENKDVQRQGLERIAEDTEPSETTESDVESDEDDTHSDTVFQDKLDKFMEYYREKNDQLFAERCEDYLNNIDSDDITLSELSGSQSLPVMTSHSISGRRRTIQPGESLSAPELELLRKVASKAISPESQKIIIDSKKNDEDPEPKLIQRELLKMINSPVPSEQSKQYKDIQEKYNRRQVLARKISKEIDSSQGKLKDLVALCVAKEKLIADLSKPVSSKRVNEKISLKQEREFVASKHISKSQIKQTKSIHEKQSREIELMNSIDVDTNKEIRKHENNLKTYKKQIEQLRKHIRKEEKRKNTLDVELVKDKMKLEELSDKESSWESSIDKKKTSLKHVTSRIYQLDSLLKEKTSDLKKIGLNEEKELMLRREIKNLRKTRECLHDQRCSLGHKRKVNRSLSDYEERKLLECEEAIEAIDTAIEFKNALICGHSPSDSLSDCQFEKDGEKRSRGEQMLMTRLDKLSHDEMKTLLYKYFQKVVDLRGACAALETSSVAASAETAIWRARCMAAWRQIHPHSSRHDSFNRALINSHQQSINSAIYNRALALDHTDSETTDDPTNLVDRVKQMARGDHQTLTIPRQNLKQLMPAMNVPQAKVTKQKNKLVIIQETYRQNH